MLYIYIQHNSRRQISVNSLSFVVFRLLNRLPARPLARLPLSYKYARTIYIYNELNYVVSFYTHYELDMQLSPRLSSHHRFISNISSRLSFSFFFFFSSNKIHCAWSIPYMYRSRILYSSK